VRWTIFVSRLTPGVSVTSGMLMTISFSRRRNWWTALINVSTGRGLCPSIVLISITSSHEALIGTGFARRAESTRLVLSG